MRLAMPNLSTVRGRYPVASSGH